MTATRKILKPVTESRVNPETTVKVFHESAAIPYSLHRQLSRNTTIILSFPSPTQAIQDRADIEPNDPVSKKHTIARKLTPNSYRETANRSAADINLRGNLEDDVFWIGQYRQDTEFQQTRIGYERQYPLPFGRVITSGQFASREFMGGSATLELSNGREAPYFGLLGFGRTNLNRITTSILIPMTPYCSAPVGARTMQLL